MRAAALVGAVLLVVPLAVALAQPRPDRGDELPVLPDLASLAPDHLTFTAPDGSPDGCLPSEEEKGARRCLRFTTYLANVGQGPLDVGLAPGTAASGRLVQRLHVPGGGWVEHRAGTVEFHAVHDHYHVAGLVAFALRALDGDGVAAPDATAAGGKTGFCLFDGAPGEEVVAPRTYQRWNCRALRNEGVGMGITPGWVDKYNWTLVDQYLEVSGVADGDYELTVVADPGHAILERRVDNNAATVRLRIAGQSVTPLQPLPAAPLPTESP